MAKAWPHGQLIGSVAMLLFAFIKEFWWDLRYETPEISGGFAGGIKDFLGYLAGIGVANLMIIA